MPVEDANGSLTATRHATERLPALDWMRGIAMVLMAVDHAGIAFHSQHIASDSWIFGMTANALPVLSFLTRWLTHICAPTFVFLAGTALALSVARRRARGSPEREIDRDILIRGLILIFFDVFWWNRWSLDVLYAIGASLIAMIGFRRVPRRVQILAALSLLALTEAVVIVAMGIAQWPLDVFRMKLQGPPGSLGLFRVLVPFFHPGPLAVIGPVTLSVQYPLLPWMAILLLGWAFGGYLDECGHREEGPRDVKRVLAWSGGCSFAVYLVVRAFDGYGNMFMVNMGMSPLSWLYTSKYPPSISFCALELALLAACLLCCFKAQERLRRPINRLNPLLVFGQTALFFYLIHKHAMVAVARLLHIESTLGLGATWMSAAIACAAMYPICVLYRRIKSRFPRGILRFL